MNYKIMEESLSELMGEAAKIKDATTVLMSRISALQRAWDKAELASHLKKEIKSTEGE